MLKEITWFIYRKNDIKQYLAKSKIIIINIIIVKITIIIGSECCKTNIKQIIVKIWIIK